MGDKVNWLFIAIIGFVALVAVGVIKVSDLQSMAGNLVGESQQNLNSGAACTTQNSIETLTMQDYTKYANSYTADSSGSMKFYASGANTADPNANPIDTAVFASGKANTTANVLRTCTQYHVIYNGTNTYYSKDLGQVSFSATDYNANRGTASIPAGEITTVGTIGDPLNEASTSGIINGQTNVNASGTNEVDTTGANGATITYDKSVGDGTYYLQVTLACNGANAECTNLGFQTIWLAGYEPEGNEITSISVQHLQGADLNIPSEIVNYWATQATVPLGTLKGGQSATYQFTFTLNEANIAAAADKWSWYIDDLGGRLAKDVAGNVDASSVHTDFDYQE